MIREIASLVDLTIRLALIILGLVLIYQQRYVEGAALLLVDGVWGIENLLLKRYEAEKGKE